MITTTDLARNATFIKGKYPTVLADLSTENLLFTLLAIEMDGE